MRGLGVYAAALDGSLPAPTDAQSENTQYNIVA